MNQPEDISASVSHNDHHSMSELEDGLTNHEKTMVEEEKS